MSGLLIYGAYGYTGALIAREAVARGLRPVLAGRNAEALQALARELGVARAELGTMTEEGRLPAALDGLAERILRIQRELFVVAAELATNPAATEKGQEGVSRVDERMLAGLEALLEEAEAGITMPREFIVPGETRLSASLELARATLRRAERRAIALGREEAGPGPWLVPYLNRLADLLWVLGRVAEGAEQVGRGDYQSPDRGDGRDFHHGGSGLP